MVWSPLHAMQAYMHTLQLCKEEEKEEKRSSSTSSVLNVIEPKAMEFISALAAGNQAQVMADISSVAISPSTLALAVAAKQTGGLLLCVRPDLQTLQQTKSHLHKYFHDHLSDVKLELRVGNPCEVIKQYHDHHHNIEFAVINDDDDDDVHDDCLFGLMGLDLSTGMKVVVINSKASSFDHGVVRRLRGRGVHVESVILPIGDHGMHVIKISANRDHHHHHHQGEVGRRSKRVFRVFDD